MRYLLFQIYAPLVSWGEIAVGGERQSSRQPSKSTITGLIAAALGIKRDEEDKLANLTNSICLAVKMYSGGTILKDFHTVQVPRKESKVVYHTRRAELTTSSDKIGTILSRREYRCDSLYVVGICLNSGVNAITLEEIQKSLVAPLYQLYFGRKSCVPALPLNPKIVEKANLKEAFDNYDTSFPLPILESAKEWELQMFEKYPKQIFYDSDISYFWEENMISGLDTLQIVERYDYPLSRRRWQFSSRKEYMAIESWAEA